MTQVIHVEPPSKKKVWVYVAGSYDDREEIRRVIKHLKTTEDIIVTHDWTHDEDQSKLDEYALLDRAGVIRSDILVLINGGRVTAGKYWECGMADALEKPILVFGRRVASIFRCLTYFRACSIKDVSLHHIVEGAIRAFLIKNPEFVRDPQTRIEDALMIIDSHGSVAGSHHKQWILDQVVRTLTGSEEKYQLWVEGFRGEYDEEYDEYDHEWDEGIAP